MREIQEMKTVQIKQLLLRSSIHSLYRHMFMNIIFVISQFVDAPLSDKEKLRSCT